MAPLSHPRHGFYEWTGAKGAKRPFLLHPREGDLIAFAGIYERWKDGEGGHVDTVAILTRPANDIVAPLHDRTPVVLPPENFAAWLDVQGTEAKDAVALLKPAPDSLFEAIELNPRINNSKLDEIGIQEPLQGQLL